MKLPKLREGENFWHKVWRGDDGEPYAVELHVSNERGHEEIAVSLDLAMAARYDMIRTEIEKLLKVLRANTS